MRAKSHESCAALAKAIGPNPTLDLSHEIFEAGREDPDLRAAYFRLDAWIKSQGKKEYAAFLSALRDSVPPDCESAQAFLALVDELEFREACALAFAKPVEDASWRMYAGLDLQACVYDTDWLASDLNLLLAAARVPQTSAAMAALGEDPLKIEAAKAIHLLLTEWRSAVRPSVISAADARLDAWIFHSRFAGTGRASDAELRDEANLRFSRAQGRICGESIRVAGRLADAVRTALGGEMADLFSLRILGFLLLAFDVPREFAGTMKVALSVGRADPTGVALHHAVARGAAAVASAQSEFAIELGREVRIRGFATSSEGRADLLSVGRLAELRNRWAAVDSSESSRIRDDKRFASLFFH